MMKCSLCGYEFNPEEAPRACQSCSIMKGCKLIRCPNCGFETPPEPKWAKYFKDEVLLRLRRIRIKFVSQIWRKKQ